MKTKYILICIFIIIVSVCSVCACTVPGGNRQDELENVIWQTDENEYGIELTFTAFGRHSERYGTFKYNDKEYDIHMDWWKGVVHIAHVGYYGNTIISDDEGREFEITGSYNIIKQSIVEIKFYDVYGDGEEFKSLKDKTITVRASSINRDEYGVGDINEITWQSENNEWKIYTYYGMRRFSVGVYETEAVKTEIAVFWFTDNTFKVYKFKESTPLPDDSSRYIDINRIEGNAFIVGTYTNDSKQLNLTYTVEGETQPRNSILYCQEIDDRQYDVNWYPSSPEAAPLN